MYDCEVTQGECGPVARFAYGMHILNRDGTVEGGHFKRWLPFKNCGLIEWSLAEKATQ